VLQLAGAEVPHLDNLVPTTGDDERVLVRGRELDARHPVVVSLLLDDVLALTEGVPESHGAIAGTRDDLTVVSGEGNRQDVLAMANKAAVGGALVQVPKAQGSIPGGGQSELAVRREHNVLDKVVVSMEALLGLSNIAFLRSVELEVPDNQTLISGGRDNHVRILEGGGDGHVRAAFEQLVLGGEDLYDHLGDETKAKEYKRNSRLITSKLQWSKRNTRKKG